MEKLTRRQFLGTAALGAGSLFIWGCGGKSAGVQPQDGSYVIAETTFGKVRGLREQGVNCFKGIPYAGSVSGKHRFGRPAPLTPWAEVRDALRLGTPAMQSASTV